MKHKARALSKEEVLKNRSNAYKFLDLEQPKKPCDCWLDVGQCKCQIIKTK